MKTHTFHDLPSVELSRMLELFERQFEYPLGKNQRFRISHGSDYGRFFRSIGQSTCIALEENGRVLGTICVVTRPVLTPDETEITATYLCDLKISPQARGGFTLLRLAQSAMSVPHGDAAFGVVMGGTAVTPTSYTGRAGIPAFANLAEIMILRIPTSRESVSENHASFETSLSSGMKCYRRLMAGRYAVCGGNPTERSRFTPTWLMLPDGSACGLLEDTLCAKRLLSTDGSELASSHLSCFAFATASAGVQLIRAAAGLSCERGLPAMFTAIAKKDSDAILAELAMDEITCAPATVFGFALPSGAAWNINTSEI